MTAMYAMLNVVRALVVGIELNCRKVAWQSAVSFLAVNNEATLTPVRPNGATVSEWDLKVVGAGLTAETTPTGFVPR